MPLGPIPYQDETSKLGEDSFATSFPVFAEDWTFQDGITICLGEELRAVVVVESVDATRRSEASAAGTEGNMVEHNVGPARQVNDGHKAY